MKKLFALFILVTVVPAWASAHDIFSFPRHRGVEPLMNKAYESSCGECHWAYPPGLLPARSWAKLMDPAQLEDHFGENAELSEKERLPLVKFLTENAADTNWHYKRSIKINQSIPEGEVPLRITQVPYIKKKHMDIPRRMIQGNKKVRSLSYCNKCHTEAASKAQFSRTNVDIPNYRNWEDLID